MARLRRSDSERAAWGPRGDRLRLRRNRAKPKTEGEGAGVLLAWGRVRRTFSDRQPVESSTSVRALWPTPSIGITNQAPSSAPGRAGRLSSVVSHPQASHCCQCNPPAVCPGREKEWSSHHTGKSLEQQSDFQRTTGCFTAGT